MSKTAVKEQKTEKAPEKPPIKRKGITLRHRPPVTEIAKPATDTPEDGIVGPVCVHRWVIESPNGETSRGRCRHCGAEKEFPNAAEDGLWERNVPQSRWTGRSDWTPKDSGY
jgi:hypothetical protein